MTSISDKNKKLLYKKLTGINQDGIIDAIVRAGGVDNINIFNDLNLFTHIESIEGIKFLKTIGYDISNINIFTCSPDIGVELIKQGYDMYKLRQNNKPVIADCDLKVIKECFNQGLDMSKFSKENHFSFYSESFLLTNEISHFLESFQNINFIDEKKLELFIDSGVFNSKNASDFDGYVPLYYFCDSRYGGKLSDKLLDKLINVYDKIDIIEDRIFDPDNERAKDFIFKRYIETCEDKQGAIEHVKGLFEKEGLDIAQSERTMATIARYDSEAIQEAFTHTAPKPSTRRRM
ncbi:hypothetical protein [Raoultella planticola]|uniref:hypothetical protein n=3 Tax=Enterobacteriaceae TaxID=543 RepID=UPI00107C327E|nr:hypothetical protein [Salmonella enterica]EIQ7171158.1 hypothetical protein [Escherichia coli]EAP6601485.1 hypothetical protein [Salmonella enterica]EAQ5067748.1 hypothetical protein [Salmonella enterica]EAW9130951.1 hypothetical protein [Salmonella enterica]